MEVTSQRTRFREIDQYPKDGGNTCAGTLKETQPCGVEEHHEVPCVVAPWSDWSKCYKTCGGGTRERSRYIQSAAKRGGLGCSNSLSQLEGCNMQTCDVPLIPVDCKLGDWEDWTPRPPEDKYDCTMDGQKFRHRPILVMPKNKGKACVGPLKVTEPCQPPVIDCVMSLWTDWDYCDKTCGGGQQQRHRLTKKPYPRNGGKPCPRTILQTQPCNTEPCFKGNCVISSWTEWGSCSATCGDATQTRQCNNPMPQHGGAACSGDGSQACNLTVCSSRLLIEDIMKPSGGGLAGVSMALLAAIISFIVLIIASVVFVLVCMDGKSPEIDSTLSEISVEDDDPVWEIDCE